MLKAVPLAALWDIPWNTPIDCGEFCLSEDDIVAFGQRYDPQPIHTDPQAARKSFFGGLIASGAHTTSRMMGQVQRSAAGQHLEGGCLSVPELRLPRPVFAGTPLRVVHTFLAPASEGLECRTEAFDREGTLIAHVHSVHAPAGAGPEGTWPRSASAVRAGPRLQRAASASTAGLWLEDCVPGAHFGSGPFRIAPGEADDYSAKFGGDTGVWRNAWFGFALATKLFIEAMWTHGHAIAGASVTNLEFFGCPRTGDECLGDVEVRASRILRSKPSLGLVDLAVSSWTSDGALSCSYNISIFAKRKAPQLRTFPNA